MESLIATDQSNEVSVVSILKVLCLSVFESFYISLYQMFVFVSLTIRMNQLQWRKLLTLCQTMMQASYMLKHFANVLELKFDCTVFMDYLNNAIIANVDVVGAMPNDGSWFMIGSIVQSTQAMK